MKIRSFFIAANTPGPPPFAFPCVSLPQYRCLLPIDQWIERYADQAMDLANASLVVAALKTSCTKIRTLDCSDFETYRLPGRKHVKLV